ncbi:hypothetical protein N7486_001639 [Penicillium sp. IBT 16267x]|nr:hypothetical protein N7486_001639 [Penicillium sp. IBT 16267x]
MNELRNRLYSIPDWGYVIYRTTYSAESDVSFPNAVRYIETCVKEDFVASYAGTPHGAETEGIRAKYRSIVMEDPQFNGASIEGIRTHFETWVDAQGRRRDNWNRFRMCLIIDEESLQTLQGISAEQIEQEGPYNWDKELRCVKVLEAWPNVDQYDTFPGWMKCWTRALWDLWMMMIDGGEMRMLYDGIDDFPFEGVFYKRKSDDFIVYVDDLEILQKWKHDRSIPLSDVLNGWKILVSHRWVKVHPDCPEEA